MRYKQIACANVDALAAVKWRGRITFLNLNMPLELASSPCCMVEYQWFHIDFPYHTICIL